LRLRKAYKSYWRGEGSGATKKKRGERARKKGDSVRFIWKKTSKKLVPPHPAKIKNNKCVVFLETGPTPPRTLVGSWIQEKKIVKKNDMFLRTKYFILVEGYNPRPASLCRSRVRRSAG